MAAFVGPYLLYRDLKYGPLFVGRPKNSYSGPIGIMFLPIWEVLKALVQKQPNIILLRISSKPALHQPQTPLKQP